MRSPKDHLLLNVGSEVYKVCPQRDALLPFLIKNNPALPVVHNRKISVSATTEGQTLVFRAGGNTPDLHGHLRCVDIGELTPV